MYEKTLALYLNYRGGIRPRSIEMFDLHKNLKRPFNFQVSPEDFKTKAEGVIFSLFKCDSSAAVQIYPVRGHPSNRIMNRVDDSGGGDVQK